MTIADDERRYREVLELSAADAVGLQRLLAALSDESWRVRKAAVERLVERAAPASVVGPLIEALGDEASASRRSAALEALVKFGEAAVPALGRAVDGSDPELRKFALDALGIIGRPEAVRVASSAIADPDLNVRFAAIEALGRVGGTEAVRTLLALVARDSAEARGAALDALGRCGAEVPFSLLEKALGDRRSRRAAVRALGRCPDGYAAAALVDALLDRTRGVREAALAAWAGREREGRTVESAFDDDARRRLVPLALEAATADELAVAEGAASLLGRLGDVDAAVPLTRLADREDLRPALRTALVRLGTAILDPLERELPVLPAASQALALEALAGLANPGTPFAVRVQALALRWIAETAEETTRLAAVDALGAAGGEASVEPLAGLLGAGGSVGKAAERALGALAPRAADKLRTLCRAVHLAQDGERGRALLRLLGRVGTTEDRAWLREIFRAEERARPRVAVAALQALRELGSLEEDLMREASGSGDPEVACEALHAAVAAGRLELVHAQIANPRWEVRCVVARALRGERGSAAQALLQKMLENEDVPLAAEEERAALRALAAASAQ